MKKLLLATGALILVGLAILAALSSLKSPETVTVPDRPDVAGGTVPEPDRPLPPPIPDAAASVKEVVVAGRVVGPDGKPIAGAEVTLALAQGAEVEVSRVIRMDGRRMSVDMSGSTPGLITLDRTATDQNGRFELSSDLAGPFTVSARARDYSRAREPSVERGRRDLVLTLKAAAVVRGRVEAEGGGPLPGAAVEAAGETALTDESGGFTLSSFPAGEETEVVASAGGFESARRSVTASAGRTVEIAEPFVLRPKPGISGRVFDPEGKPLSAVRVAATRGMFDQSMASTDRGGRYHLGDVPTGDVSLILRHREYLPKSLDRFRYTKGERLVLPDVRLEPGGEITGKVAGPEGRPVEGARMLALKSDLGLDLGSIVAMTLDRLGGPTSDAAGSYRVAGLETGTYTLVVRANGYLPFRQEDVAVTVPEATRVDVTLDPGKSIAGRVLDPEGAPVAGASVDAASKASPTSFQEGILMSIREGGVTTREDGSFVLRGLGDDPVTVTVTAEGYATKNVEGVEPGTSDLEIRLGRSGSVSGRVTDAATGNPVAGASVFVGDNSVVTNEDGMFLVPGLSPGTFELSVDHSEYPPASVEDVVVAEGVETSGIEVLLERGETLVGTVVSGVTGAPLPGAVVSVEGPAARQATALGGGRFEVRGLLAGSYELTAKAAGHARKVIRSIRVPAAEELRIALEQGATVRGVVKDAEGEPQSGRMVMLAEGGSFGPNLATTDENGEFSFADIAAGKHTLMLMSMGTGGGFSMEAQTRQVTVKAGEEVFVEFGGRGAVRKATLKGRLLDRGKPVGTRMLMIVPVRRGGGLGLMSGMKMVTTDAEGRFSVPDLEPGRYAVLSSSMGSGTMTSGSEIVIDEGGEIERDIELPPGRLAGKVVRGDTGQPVVGAQVTLLDPERVAVPARSLGDMLAIFKGQARTGDGGAFEFPNAPVGRFMLQVIVEGAAPAVIDAVEVTEAAAAPLNVTVVPGAEVTVTVSDPEGEPFPRATVFVLDARGRIVLLSQSLGETTGADGLARFRLVPGEYRVLVQAEGHAQAAAPLSVGGGQASEVAVRLARGGTVRVAVTSGGGSVAGADVRVFGEDGLEIAERVTQESMMGGAPETVTGDDGTVTLENQPAGNLRLVVTAADGRKGETRVLVTEAGEHEVAVNLK